MNASPDLLTPLAAARATLEAHASFWSALLEVATGAVVFGVMVEILATVLEVREELSKGGRPQLRHIVTFVGAAIIAFSCAAELLAEHRADVVETALRTNNAQEQRLLSERANTATADAVSLAQRFGGLNNFVMAQEKQIDTARAALAKSEHTLSRARDEAVRSAQSVKSALATARASERDLLAATGRMNELSEQIRILTTPRTICVSCVAQKLRGFGKVPFVITASDDSDALDLARQLASALTRAGWKWMSADTSLVYRMPGEPSIGQTIGHGVRLEIAQSDRNALIAPGTALVGALIGEKLQNVGGAVLTDDAMKNVSAIHNAIHLMVGSRD